MNRDEISQAIMHGSPRVHATGFAQIYLRRHMRLHVWTENLLAQAPDITQIVFKHDHRYGIESHVLAGTIHDERAQPMIGPGLWQLWEVRPAGQGLPEVPQLVDHATYMCETSLQRIVKAGQSYTIPKRTFHASRAVGTTVTVMRKDDEEDGWARLLVPRGFSPIHSLAKQPSQAFIKDEMIRAVWNVGNAEYERVTN